MSPGKGRNQKHQSTRKTAGYQTIGRNKRIALRHGQTPSRDLISDFRDGGLRRPAANPPYESSQTRPYYQPVPRSLGLAGSAPTYDLASEAASQATPDTRHSTAGVLRLSGAMPSALTSLDGLLLRATGLRVCFFSPAFLSVVFFFFTPTALPDALTFFGPW